MTTTTPTAPGTAVVQTKPAQLVAKIPTTGDFNAWTDREAALMSFAGLGNKIVTGSGQIIWQGAPRSVVEAFLVHVNRTQLDPTAKQIYCVELGGKWTILVGIDGMRLVAERTGRYQGQTPKEWTYDGINWSAVPIPPAPGAKPLAARVGIRRQGYTEPQMVTITWAEFGMEPRYAKDNWGIRPAHMLGIRVESHGLRMTFPMELSGLYTREDYDTMVVVEGDPAAALEEGATGYSAEIAALDDKADAAKLYHRITEAQDWSPALTAEFKAKVGTITKDSRPAQQGAPGHTGDARVDQPSPAADLPAEDGPTGPGEEIAEEVPDDAPTDPAPHDTGEVSDEDYAAQERAEYEAHLAAQGTPEPATTPAPRVFIGGALGGAE